MGSDLTNTLYVEIRHDLIREGIPKIVPIEDCSNHYGFRSMYPFDCVIKAVIDYNKHTRGLDVPVYSQELFVDFDDAKEAAQRFYNWLVKNDIAFEVYDSGGRSIHFHVDITEMYGKDVHLKQKDFVKQYAPGADLSIYKLFGIFRLPGTYHTKHGGRKTLLKKCGIFPLVIDNYPIERASNYYKSTGIHNNICLDKMGFYERVTIEASQSGRRPHLFKIIASGVDVGKSFEEVASSCWIWNNYLADPPLDNASLERYIKQTYLERIRSCNAQDIFNSRSGFI